MRPLARVLKQAHHVWRCTTAINMRPCSHCGNYLALYRADPELLEAVEDAEERGLITWKHYCGWMLTPRGEVLYKQLQGDFT